MNHNFLPYEVCCMLPENNPYNRYYVGLSFKHKRIWIVDGQGNKHICEIEDFPVTKHNIKDSIGGFRRTTSFDKKGNPIITEAWTILDALQWLEDNHNIIVETGSNVFGDFEFAIAKYNEFTHQWELKTSSAYIFTRTEAYIAGIKQALELI